MVILHERELKALNEWFTSFKEYPVGFVKGNRVYITTVLNDEPEKELVYCCVETPEIYKCEMLMDDWSKDNDLIEPDYYELELTDYGFIIRHHNVTLKGWTLVDYVEDTHFKYEKEVVL